MRIALIADIHGNLAALDAVLQDLAAACPDRMVCLGDVAATGPQPRAVLERLRALQCPIVLGNTDAWLMAPSDTAADEDARKVAEIDRWCAEQLTHADRAFIHTFVPTITLPLGDARQLLCYHGSPRSYDDVIAATTPDDELAPMFAGRTATVMAGGHWHFPMLRHYRESLLVNPGSVGLAYDLRTAGGVRVPPHAAYALLTAGDDSLRIEFRRVPYDRHATVRAMFERGMPHAVWWSRDWD